jgi:hypothetical protein
MQFLITVRFALSLVSLYRIIIAQAYATVARWR